MKAAGVALLALLGATRAAAQAPAQDPPPPRPAASAPVQLPAPRTLPPPPRPAAAAAPAVTPVPATVAQVRAASRPGGSPDSVRPAAATLNPAPPANAVARCTDGTYVVAPNDPATCAAHGGTRVRMPLRTAAPVPVRHVVEQAALRAPPADPAPPAGATMRCKDGTFLTGAPADGRCDANGGLAALLPAARSTPPPPPRPRRP